MAKYLVSLHVIVREAKKKTRNMFGTTIVGIVHNKMKTESKLTDSSKKRSRSKYNKCDCQIKMEQKKKEIYIYKSITTKIKFN